MAAGGYGSGTAEKVVGISVLVIGVLLFLFRRIVQDKQRPHWREETPTMPPGMTEAAPPPPEPAPAATV